jgi:hypothetical protein
MKRGQRVFVVDDEYAIMTTLAMILSTTGDFDASPFTQLLDALSKARFLLP